MGPLTEQERAWVRAWLAQPGGAKHLRQALGRATEIARGPKARILAERSEVIRMIDEWEAANG